MGYTLSEGYSNLSTTDHRQELVQTAGLSIPLVSSTVLSATTALSLSLSATDALSAKGTHGFTFLEGVGMGNDASGLEDSNDVYLTLGASFLRTVQGSAMDLFPRSEVDASAAVSFYPPVLSSDGPGPVATALFSVSIPSPIPHEVIKLGVKGSYVGLGGTFYQVTTARGLFDPVVQSLPGRALISIDYQVPIALLDIPLGYSLGIVGIGCALHLEAAADWSAAPGTFTPDQDVYGGGELVLNLAVGEGQVPVGLGIAVKFDPRFQTPVNWATDLRPYVFVSTDSFASSGVPGRGSATLRLK